MHTQRATTSGLGLLISLLQKVHTVEVVTERAEVRIANKEEKKKANKEHDEQKRHTDNKEYPLE